MEFDKETLKAMTDLRDEFSKINSDNARLAQVYMNKVIYKGDKLEAPVVIDSLDKVRQTVSASDKETNDKIDAIKASILNM